jgi:hypothetical protein
MTKKIAAVAATLVVALVLAAPAMSFGPQHDTGPAFDACDISSDGGVVVRQQAAGIQAGGGPKSKLTAPTNCDHFWQDPAQQVNGGGVIGNDHWPPPPFPFAP